MIHHACALESKIQSFMSLICLFVGVKMAILIAQMLCVPGNFRGFQLPEATNGAFFSNDEVTIQNTNTAQVTFFGIHTSITYHHIPSGQFTINP